jgi:hypothetical protein
MKTRCAIHSMSSPSVPSPRRIAGHRGPNGEELDHQPTADPDDGHRHVHEEQELTPRHQNPLVCAGL